MEDRRLLHIGIAVAVVLIVFLIWWLWPPTARSDRASIDPNSQRVSINVLANDSDLFGRRFFIKDWSKTANGGTVMLAPGGVQLVYEPPPGHSVASDTFTYSIWTRHGFPSTATVTVAIKSGLTTAALGTKPGWRKVAVRVPTTAANFSADCPRGEAHSTSQRAPLPKEYRNCFAIYFSWDSSRAFNEHARAVKALLEKVAKEAAGKTAIVEGFTDTSGVHYMALSKKRACSVASALKSDGLGSASIETLAKGTEDPAVATAGDVRDRLNRRVEIRFLAGVPQLNADTVACDR